MYYIICFYEKSLSEKKNVFFFIFFTPIEYWCYLNYFAFDIIYIFESIHLVVVESEKHWFIVILNQWISLYIHRSLMYTVMMYNVMMPLHFDASFFGCIDVEMYDAILMYTFLNALKRSYPILRFDASYLHTLTYTSMMQSGCMIFWCIDVELHNAVLMHSFLGCIGIWTHHFLWH